ncbi:MAG: T9SS C-terminal target domain-containing protein, partial [Balneolaceae bacterium]
NADQAIRAEGNNLLFENNTFTGHQTGIDLLRTLRNRADNARVINNTFTGNDIGLNVQSSNVEVHGNTFSGNIIDLQLSVAQNAIITDNQMETGLSLDLGGATVTHDFYFDHQMSGNTVDGRPLFFARETESPSIPDNAAQIFLYDVQDAVISGKTFEGLAAGIIVGYSSGIEISDNVLDNIGGQAIGVWMSEETVITGNSVSNTGIVTPMSGIAVTDSPGSLVQSNTVANTTRNGVALVRSSNATVDGNTLNDNQRYGLHVASASNDVTASNNTVENNGQVGIRFTSNSSRGLITGNTVTGNEEQGIHDGMNSHQSVISDNIVTNNGLEGIDFRSPDMVITGNTVSGNGGIFGAINSGSRSLVANNTVTDNDTDGIRVGLNSTVRNNVSTGNSGIGIDLRSARDIVASNNEVRDNGGPGIRISRSNNAVVDSNIVSGHDVDLYIHDESRNATVRNNTFESGVAIYSFNGLLAELDHTFINNTVRDGAPLFFARNEDGPEIPPDAGQIIIVTSSNIDISGFDLSHVAAGIQIIYSEDVRIADNTFEGNSGNTFTGRTGAITVWGTPELIVENNTMTNGGSYGISVFKSPGALVTNNQSAGNGRGALFFESPGSVFRHNTITGSGFLGFELIRSDSMTVFGNTISDSVFDGVLVENSFMVSLDSNTVANNGRHGVFFESSDSLFIRDNVVTDNANSGLESHFGFRSSDGATITGNTVTGNGRHGINFPVDGVYVAENNIRNNENGILVANPAVVENNRIVGNSENGLVVNVDATDVLVVNNSIRGNGGTGLFYNRSQPLMAVNNWWGNANGPSGGVEDPETGVTANGSGDAIRPNVRFDPWLATDPFGETDTSADDADALAGVFALDQNYPNPFNPTTQIRYHLPADADVRLTVYSILGERIATLVNERQQAGAHEVMLDASHLASGVYIYRIEAGDFGSTRKMLLVR